jgi:xylose isomerase-like TIM barrel
MAIEKSLIVNPLWTNTPAEHQIDLLNNIIDDVLFSTIEIWDTSDAYMLEVLKNNAEHINFDVSLSVLMSKQGIPNCVSSPKQVEKWTTYIIKRIQSLSQIGIKSISISSPVNDPNADRIKQIESFKEAITEVCRKASQKNMIVCIEPFDVSVDKKRILGTTLEIEDVFEHRICDNLFLTWDLGHICLNNEDYLISLESLLSYIKRIHISNYNLDHNSIYFGDKHLPFNKIGMIRENDITAIMCFLKQKNENHLLGRNISVGIEVATNELLPSVSCFEQTYKYVCSMINTYLC